MVEASFQIARLPKQIFTSREQARFLGITLDGKTEFGHDSENDKRFRNVMLSGERKSVL